jgi:hypothetical protein
MMAPASAVLIEISSELANACRAIGDLKTSLRIEVLNFP